MNDVKSVLTKELNSLKKAIEERMAAEKVTASGRTRASLQVVVNENEGTLFGASYFRQLEKGRGPGSVPRNFTEVIREWIKAKGIDYDSYVPKGRNGAKMTSEQHLTSLSGAIAHTIMTQGTVMYRNGTPKDIYSEALQQAVERISDSIGDIMATRIQTINDNYSKYENDQS